MSSGNTRSQLKEAFGGQELAWLRKRLRKRIERDGILGERLLVNSPTLDQRRSIERLLGRPGEFGKHLSIRISDLQTILAPLGAEDLRLALEILDGPIVSNQQRRELELAEWTALLESVEREFSNVAIESHRLSVLLEGGTLKRASGNIQKARSLLLKVVSVLTMIRKCDTQEKLCRPELAARALGDSHALDSGQPLVTILKRLYDANDMDDFEFWKTLNIALDETSSTVLILNFRCSGGDLAPALNEFALAGEPCRVTLKTIDRGLKTELDEVYVCENPAILHSAALRLGTKTRPIICTEGQPSFACQKLLRQLSSNNTRLFYHGDFDWGGIKIANFLFREMSMIPWRFSAADYEQLNNGFVLKGEPIAAIWDAELCPRMEQRNQGFHEEMILASLLNDLALSKV